MAAISKWPAGRCVYSGRKKFWNSKLFHGMQAEKLRYAALWHGLRAVAHLTQRIFDVNAPPRCVIARATLSADVVYLDVFMGPARVIGLSVASRPYNLVARRVTQYHAASTLPCRLVWFKALL